MLLVKTKLGVSSINGIGLFADEFIPKGTVTWKSTPGLDLKCTQKDLEKLSPPARETFMRYCFHSKRSGLYILCFDNARFFNHSLTPNILDGDSADSDEGVDIAARDIHPGEEMTCDYREFDAQYLGFP